MSNKVVLASALVAALSLLVQRGVAQDLSSFHREPWPIHNGFNHQPTQIELRALHHQDVTPDEVREITVISCQATKRFSGNILHPDIDRHACWCPREKSTLVGGVSHSRSRHLVWSNLLAADPRNGRRASLRREATASFGFRPPRDSRSAFRLVSSLENAARGRISLLARCLSGYGSRAIPCYDSCSAV